MLKRSIIMRVAVAVALSGATSLGAAAVTATSAHAVVDVCVNSGSGVSPGSPLPSVTGGDCTVDDVNNLYQVNVDVANPETIACSDTDPSAACVAGVADVEVWQSGLPANPQGELEACVEVAGCTGVYSNAPPGEGA